MRFSVFDQWGAGNSRPVWQAFREGCARLGLTAVGADMSADVAVIWSLVWSGRMRSNQQVWQNYLSTGRPVIVLEVGTLRRGTTWKIGVNGLGSSAYWGEGLDPDRPRTLGLRLHPWRDPGRDILIALQRNDSEQWAQMPRISTWLSDTVNSIRQHSSRSIHVRRHPRQLIEVPPGCGTNVPRAIPNSYDDFDFDTSIESAWAVVNVNSGAGVRAAMLGVPVFVHESSLAAPVGNLDWAQIENPQKPCRDAWFQGVCHTEWTLEEIRSGRPLQRLLPGLESR